MSCIEVNDENRGVSSLGGKHSDLNEDIFAVGNPTGRPSILRQTENLPSNTVAKGTKVCFQTPRRDPLTKRILSPSKTSKMTNVDECIKAMESLHLEKTNLSKQAVADQTVQTPEDEMPLPSGGEYQLNFENLDALNPFQSSNKMALSPLPPATETPPQISDKTSPSLAKTESALDDTLPFNPSVENSLNASVDIGSTESSVVTVNVLSKTSEDDEQDSCAEVLNPKLCEGQKKATEESPLPAKGSYNFNFDCIDAVNPFLTGGSKIPNSPACERFPPEMEVLAAEVNPTELDLGQEKSSQPEAKPVAEVAPNSGNTNLSHELESLSDSSMDKSGPVKLEFNFDDKDDKKLKPRPKKLGIKRPTSQKVSKEVKPVKNESMAESKGVSDEVPISKGSYSFDLGKFDEPDFNPFGSKSTICNSPKGKVTTSPESVKSIPEEEPGQKDAVLFECLSEHRPVDQPSPKEDLTVKAVAAEGVPPEAEHMSFSEQKSQGSLLEEEFVPGTTFLSHDFEGQMDYLEQFGSGNFKESALRKQSLYLKFDPLLRDSPKKSSGPAVAAPVPRPTALISNLNTQLSEKERQKDYFKLLDVATEPCAPVLRLPPVTQPTNAEDNIIEMLKYSQKDMDGVMARVQAEAEETEMQWRVKYNKLLDDGQEMRKIIAEFELMIAKMLADREKEKEVAKAKLKEALMEKDQVSSDLNTMERSFSDLFKRLEKYKTVIEGYKKNEETLKNCAQDYLARIKTEEQRYQTLKAHAEEKINQANKEIAEVRSKNKSEVSVLHAQLRREQVKVQSLEKNLSQKEKEAEELAKLCDELISNVQKG